MQVLLEELDLGDVLLSTVVEDASRLAPELVEQRAWIAEAACDQLGLTAGRRPVFADRCHDDQDPVLREMAPVADRDVLYVPHAQAVDERHAGVDLAHDARGAAF